MATERQREIALALVLVVLAFVLYRAVTSPKTTTSLGFGGSASSSNGRAGTARSARITEPPETAPDVHLRALDNARPTPISGERDLFRFRPAPAPSTPRPAPPSVVRDTPGVPAGPSALSPIPLKFIGIVEAPAPSKRIAALVDSTGASGTGLLAAILFDAVAAGTTTLTTSGAATGPGGAAMGLQFQPVTVIVQ